MRAKMLSKMCNELLPGKRNGSQGSSRVLGE